MTWPRIIPLALFLAGGVGDGVISWAQSAPVIEVGKFSSGQPGAALPQGWQPLTFTKIPRHTEYGLVRDGGQVVVKATSEASAPAPLRTSL